jgi:hypothetical protein
MSYQNGPGITRNSLIFYMNPGYASSTSSSIFDLTNNGCNGNLTNGATLSPSNRGVVVLDGSNDYIDFPSNNIFNNAVTIEIWFYLNSISDRILICAGDNSYNSAVWDWSIFPYGGSMLCRGNPGGGGTNIGLLSTIYLQKWNQLVLNRTGPIYRNGTLIGTTTFTGSGSTKPLRIGRTGTTYFSGSIGPVAIYSRSLSSSEILQNYNALKGRFQI